MTYAIDYIWFSQTRAWMALARGAVMAIVVVFALSLWLVRSQETVDDGSYMKAMIPHHSIAVLASRRAHIRDKRVRKLADDIIEVQVREIGEMENLIASLSSNPVPEDAPDLPPGGGQ